MQFFDVMRSLCTAAFVTAAFGTARADDGPTVKALLGDPAQLAAWLADRDPVLESARFKTEAAQATARQARVYPNPQLNVTSGGYLIGHNALVNGDGSTSDVSLGDSVNFGLGVTELVEIGKRGPRAAAADLRTSESGELAVGALGGRVTDATTALGKLAYVTAKRDVAAANLAAAQHIREIEKVRVDKDDLSKLDFGRIDLDTDELDLTLRRAESEVAMAQAACSASLMTACDTTGLDQSVLDAAAPLPEGAVTGALDQRPSIIAGRIEQKALGQDAELAHNRRIPDLTFGVDYLFDNFVASGNLHQQLIFSVGLPLPLFDRGDHDAAAARANARALDADERATIRGAKGQVAGLVAQQAALAETLRKLETEAIPKSTLVILQTQKAFDLGQTRLPDLLLAQRSHRDLLLEVLETRFDLFTARAQLRQLLGLDDAVARQAAQQRKR